MRSTNVRERTAVALLTLVGVALAGAVLFDVYQDWLLQGTTLRSTAIENLIPLALSLAVPVAAWRLAGGETDSASLTIVAKWTLVGLGSTVFVGGWVVGIQLHQDLLKPWTVVLQLTIFGTLAGLLVGRSVARSAHRTEQLGKVETRYGALAEAFPDYAFLYDTDGEYLDAILGWEREGGRTYTADELVGATVHDVLPAETAETILAAVQEAAEMGSIQRTEYRIEMNGVVRRFEGRASPLDEPIGGEEAVIFVARDVTEQHELREELENQNERLDRFARMVSHDLRSPLSVAEGHLGLVEADESEHLAKAQTALDRMESIIEDTLVLARQGQTVSEMEPVEIEAIAPLCWGTVETEDADITIVESFEIRADADRLRHLLENCFRNAVEHGGSDVSVRVGRIDESGFYVADDGCGLPQEAPEELFEPGYTTDAEGTGFGLTIVTEIARAHDWEVDVTESTEGGARFEITGVEFVQ